MKTDPNLTAALHIRIQVPGSPDEGADVPAPGEGATVAGLVRARAGAEWDARRRIGREAAPPRDGDAPAPRSREECIRASLDAFRAGWFVVFVNDDPAPSLDTPVAIGPATRVRFARLYPGKCY